MQIQIAAPKLTLADLRGLIKQTEGWPDDCSVQPRGGRGRGAAGGLSQSSVTVSQVDYPDAAETD